mmetsp:Transcript_13375/g.15923  ORF Transcript_13375/g.15923 Transcript_13375/m.15923 type:complete len:445 (-) Transcript_13375:181-1515(-)
MSYVNTARMSTTFEIEDIESARKSQAIQAIDPLECTLSGEQCTHGEVEQPPERPKPQKTMSTGSIRNRGFSNASDVNLRFKHILLFSGITRPSSYFSFWWICYFGWRLLSILSLVLLALTFSTKPVIAQLWFFAPLFFATVAAMAMWYWLPQILADALAQGGAYIPAKDAKKIIKVPTMFISLWLILGIFFSLSRAYVTGRFLPCLFTFCIENSTTPILGSVLLALTIETRLAKNEIDMISECAIDRSLTCEMYLDIKDSIKKRSQRWKKSLYILSFTALYCTIGFIVTLGYLWDDQNNKNKNKDDDDTLGIFYSDSRSSDILLDIIVASELAKEVALLFIFLFLVMGINDRADSITSILLNSKWGESNDPQEVVRAHLLFLNTTYAPPPEKLNSWYNFFTFSDSKPISFSVFGVRVSRRLVVAAVISLFLGLANAFSREFTTN